MLLALETIDVLQAGYLHRYLLDGGYRPAYPHLKHMNLFLREMATANIPNWTVWRLESVLPNALAVTPVDPAAGLAWLSAHEVIESLLVVLRNADGGQRHVVAIVKLQGEKAILDTFERLAMRYSDLALAVSSGGSVVTGLGEVYKLVPHDGAAVGTSGVVQSEGASAGGAVSGRVEVGEVSPTGARGVGTVAGSSPAGPSRKRTAAEKRKAKRDRKKARKAAADAAAGASGTGGDGEAVGESDDDVHEV